MMQIIPGVKLAYYRKSDYTRFINMIDDKRNMHENWEEWYDDFIKIKLECIKNGFKVIDVIVNLDELAEYCKIRGIKNDGKARAEFVRTR